MLELLAIRCIVFYFRLIIWPDSIKMFSAILTWSFGTDALISDLSVWYRKALISVVACFVGVFVTTH